MRLFLVRHGETVWNIEGRYQGWADQPLSELGREQAVEVAHKLASIKFDAAYCSDLQRSIVTTEIILKGRGIEAVQLGALREINIGKLDGLTEQEIKSKYPEQLRRWRDDPGSLTMPGGESLADVEKRVWAALEELIERHRGQTVLVVAHHTVNKTILCRLLGMPYERFRVLRQPPCAVSVVDFREEGSLVWAVNLNWHEAGRSWHALDDNVRKRLLEAKAFIFDFDGVVLGSMPFYAAAWRQALAERGIVPPEVEFYRRESERGENSVRHFYREAGLEAGEEEIKEVVGRVRELYAGYPGIAPRQGALEVVAALKRAGKKTALVTGSPRSDVERMLSGEQIALFDVVIAGDDVANGKPDPEPYRLALQKLVLAPERAVAIENSPYGVRSARAAGLLTAGLTSTLPAEELVDAEMVIDSLERLAAWLDIRPA
jgi:broad specificity phosphatase PhoE/beta-phosphoglucomutase-like phosphatase (HAD superfamily)